MGNINIINTIIYEVTQNVEIWWKMRENGDANKNKKKIQNGKRKKKVRKMFNFYEVK